MIYHFCSASMPIKLAEILMRTVAYLINKMTMAL